jgi:thioredoxin 2
MSDTLAVCSTCGATNRLPLDKPALRAKCAKCGTRLFGVDPADVTGENFDRQITRGSVPLLVDVWAPWCGPCKMMTPAFAEAARQLEPQFRLVKLNSDSAPEISNRLQIRSIPTMILFHKGGERARVSGAMSVGQIVQWASSQI